MTVLVIELQYDCRDVTDYLKYIVLFADIKLFKKIKLYVCITFWFEPIWNKIILAQNISNIEYYQNYG